MSRTRVEEKWQEFSKVALAKSDKLTTERGRAVFFCGAASMLRILQEIGNDPDALRETFAEFDREMKVYEAKGAS